MAAEKALAKAKMVDNLRALKGVDVAALLKKSRTVKVHVLLTAVIGGLETANELGLLVLSHRQVAGIALVTSILTMLFRADDQGSGKRKRTTTD